jgi:predicted permease
MSPKLHEFRLRLKALFQKRRMDRDMAEELAFHQDLLREKLLREGVPQSEVDAAMRRNFGNASRWHELLSELWQFRWLEHLVRDVSFSARLLRKSPVFTTVAVLTLVLGVGANMAIFSMINGLLLRPLPVPHSEQLVVLRIDLDPGPQYTLPAPFFRSIERRHEVFSDVFAFSRYRFQVRGRSGNEELAGEFVSGGFFSALQAAPLLGRTLSPQDDRTGGNPSGLAVVISEDFWDRWFNHASDVVGRKLQIDNVVFTVAGVMPRQFIGADPTARPEIYVPLAAEPFINADHSITAAGVNASWLSVMARMRADVTLAQVNAWLLPLSMPIVREYVTNAGWIASAEKNHFRFTAEPGSRGFTYVRRFFAKPLYAVFAMCAGILLLSCFNLASLLMARGASRERELATRLALGAGRRRLVQQMLIESLMIALFGTAIGLAVAPLVSRSLAAMLMASSAVAAPHIDTSLDIRVFFFAAVIAVLASLFIGLLPALQATSGNLSDHIKEGQHSARVHNHRRLLFGILLVSEVAIALVLVIGAGLIAVSLSRLYRSGAGFDPEGLVNIGFNMDKQPLKPDALARRYQQIDEALAHQPGVRDASISLVTPFTGFIWDETHSASGRGTHDLDMNAVGPAYFRTMRIPIIAGREFTWADTSTSGLKIILNHAAAKLFFPDRNPIGQHITRVEEGKAEYEVIAVVGDAKYSDMRESAPASAYVSVAQNDQPMYSYSAVLRVDGPIGPLAAAARSLTMRIAPDIPAPVITTMSSVIDDSISSERLMALLSIYFAACALLVTAIGLYGTLAYSTARRTSEIGIRIALGSGRARVVTLVFRENAIVAFAGMAAGFAIALFATRALSSLLYGTSTRDPWVLSASLLALGLVAGAASLIPALRAAQIEPLSAIRCE